MPDQADADPVVALLDWFQGNQEALDLLGGADHFSGILEAPWPHVVVGDGPAGNYGTLDWGAELEVALRVVGAPDGSPGDAALRKIAVRLMRIARDLADSDQLDPTKPVVGHVRPSGTTSQQTLKTGQRQYHAGLMVSIHPPLQ